MGRFRIQFLLGENTWSTRHNMPKTDRYCDTSNHWTKLGLIFTEEINGSNLFYDDIDSAHADICFSNITIPHSVFQMNYKKLF